MPETAGPDSPQASEPAPSLFLGSPDFAVPSLEALAESPLVSIRLVITQPDRSRGRGMRLHPTPVKEAAGRLSIPVRQPEKLGEEQMRQVLSGLPPLDFIFVVAYGKKIPRFLLEYPRHGCINLHPSLLPKYRGGAPMRRTLFNGDTETGVTTMYLDEGWDTGDLILQEKAAIPPDFNHGQLSELLAQRGAALMVETVRRILAGDAPRTQQDERRATHEPLLKSEEEWIDWSQPAEAIRCRVRGLAPEPASRTVFRGSILKLLRVSVIEISLPETSPGTVIACSKAEGIVVATGAGSLRLEELQPQGKRLMSAADFRNGYQVQTSEVFSQNL